MLFVQSWVWAFHSFPSGIQKLEEHASVYLPCGKIGISFPPIIVSIFLKPECKRDFSKKVDVGVRELSGVDVGVRELSGVGKSGRAMHLFPERQLLVGEVGGKHHHY